MDGANRIKKDAWSPTRTSTSAAPSCFAARMTRATSAWVMVAGGGACVGHGR